MDRSALRRPERRGWASARARPRRSLWGRLSAAQMFVGSFLLMIVIGTLGLMWLPGLYMSRPLSWLDALFTITSATCVTGLVVVDTATHFSIWGQLWLLVFIQLGGLGMLTFATVLTFALGGRLSLRDEELWSQGTEVAPHLNLTRLIQHVVLYSLLIEGVGAVLLYGLWQMAPGPHAGTGWHALFHSISAFCNAGFSTFPDSLSHLPEESASLVVIGSLIVLGSLGFVVLEEFSLGLQAWARRARRKATAPEPRAPRQSLHSRLVLATTLVLVVVGWAAFALLEWDGLFGGRPAGEKAVHAWFMSVTPRTAGFNTVDYSRGRDATNCLTIFLMTIGGSPGSTAGGIKTTTFALIVLLAWSRLRGRGIVQTLGRSVPEETVQRAVGVAVFGLGLLALSVMVLTLTEDPEAGGDGRFLKYLFECSSALNTVGLSLGLTPRLSAPAKTLMIGLMFLGRVGPASAAAALAVGRPLVRENFRLAYERVAVG